MKSPKFKKGRAFVIPMDNVGLSIPRESNQQLLAIAQLTGACRTDLIRSAIDQYLERVALPKLEVTEAQRATDAFLYGVKK